MMSRRKAISLFSGAGGMDIGIKKAGFSVLAELEIDKYCCQTLRAAVERECSNTRVIESDIRAIEPKDIANMFNLLPKELDLLFEIIRFAEYLKPKAILLEQVKGFLSEIGRASCRERV